MTDIANGLKRDLKAVEKENNPQERALMIIRKAVKLEDAKKVKEEFKDVKPLGP